MAAQQPTAWPLFSTVLLSLAGAVGGALLLALPGLALGGWAGSWTVALVSACVFAGVGALAGFTLVLVALIGERVRATERRLLGLIGTLESAPHDSRASESAPPRAPVRSRPSSPAPAEPLQSSAPVEPETAPLAARSASADEAAAVSRSTPSSAPAAPPSGVASVTRRVLDWFRNGNTIARAGILVLFVGAALLAKYAAESGWFPLEARLAAVALLGMVLLGLGWRLRGRHQGYALILQGGGVALLYLTLYVGFRLFGVLPAGLAFALMVVVALAAAVLAVAQNALALAVIGFSGGFLAPLLTSEGGGSHITLFSYYTVLNLGVFAVAWFRAWRSLNLVGFVFTFGVSALWRGAGYGPEHLFSTDAFLILFFLMYVAVSLLFARQRTADRVDYLSGSLVFGLPVAAFTLHASLVGHIEHALAWSALALAVFYLVLAAVLWRSRGAAWRLMAEAFAALGVIFATLTVPLVLSGEATAVSWALEGAGLVWLGGRQGRRLTRVFGLLLQVLAALSWAYDGGSPATLPVFNGAFMALAGLAVAGYLSGLFLFRLGPARAAYERVMPPLLLAWSISWALLAGVREVAAFGSEGGEAGWLLAVPALITALVAVLGRRLAWPASARLAPLLGAAFLVLVTLALTVLEHPLMRGAWLGWPLLWLVYHGVLWRRDQDAGAWLPGMTPWLHGLGVWALAWVALGEVPWWIGQALAGVWPMLAWGLIPALLLVVCTRAPALWPWRDHRRAYLGPAALPLAVVMAAWVVVMNLGSRGDPAPLPYLPLLNPLDISVALALLAGLGWWRAAWPGRWSVGVTVAVGLAFVWLSAALVRALHYGVGTPLEADGMLRSVTVQMALSLFWALLGLAAMISATRRGWRPVWMAGMALLGVVVVKLFLVDLAGTETLARTVSFLGVGLVLLVVGYFSPLPPRAKESS
ncbi:DUF2339 domain-containing protein [Alloalcanivorax marinus]|uniref:DUF2339 domain-containing protein n=1 Tax=Alloalcanivorax marinus TaxID=1177169 RepID=UPI0019341B81|nr:DUF2339 domain-containing protein [Alloalcanivorax marinus]MBL7251889.1 DUF2339 domain-containing protein [Alloalcanivorax marinus]